MKINKIRFKMVGPHKREEEKKPAHAASAGLLASIFFFVIYRKLFDTLFFFFSSLVDTPMVIFFPLSKNKNGPHRLTVSNEKKKPIRATLFVPFFISTRKIRFGCQDDWTRQEFSLLHEKSNKSENDHKQ